MYLAGWPGEYSRIIFRIRYSYITSKPPPIETTWEVTAQYLVPFMREKGYQYECGDLDGVFSFWWFDEINGYGHKKAEIKDDNLALAACEAFMEVEI